MSIHHLYNNKEQAEMRIHCLVLQFAACVCAALLAGVPGTVLALKPVLSVSASASLTAATDAVTTAAPPTSLSASPSLPTTTKPGDSENHNVATVTPAPAPSPSSLSASPSLSKSEIVDPKKEPQPDVNSCYVGTVDTSDESR
jgi:hypothetical protein